MQNLFTMLKRRKIYPEIEIDINVRVVSSVEPHNTVNPAMSEKINETRDPCVKIYKKYQELGAYDQYSHKLLLSESLRMIKNQI